MHGVNPNDMENIAPDESSISYSEHVKPPMSVGTQGISMGNQGNTTMYSAETFPVTFEWLDKGNEVFVTGSFFNWQKKVKLNKIEENVFRITMVNILINV